MNPVSIKIANQTISDYSPTFIIAEVGVNHEGNYKKCIEMIKNAKLAGANAVKLQLSKAELNYYKKSKSYKIYKNSQFSLNQIYKIYNFAEKNNIILFFTMDEYHFKKIKIKQKLYKISSSQFNDLKLIKDILKKNRPLLISTGMSDIKEINALSKFLRNKSNVIFMHCISKYPLKDTEANLKMIGLIKKITKGIVGYSDHTKDTVCCEIAAILGAKIIEKHYSFDNKRKGFDHKISLNFESFKKMVKNIRYLEKMIGNVKQNNEIKNSKKVSRQKRSYFLNKDLRKGYRLKLKDIFTKRIGKSDKIENLIEIIGKKLNKNYIKNTQVNKKILV